MPATPIASIEVIEQQFYEGIGFIKVPCHDFAEFRRLPAAINFEGKAYGKSGWNSDHNVAYYRTDKPFATIANVKETSMRIRHPKHIRVNGHVYQLVAAGKPITASRHPEYIKVKGHLYKLASSQRTAVTDRDLGLAVMNLNKAYEAFRQLKQGEDETGHELALEDLKDNAADVLRAVQKYQ